MINLPFFSRPMSFAGLTSLLLGSIGLAQTTTANESWNYFGFNESSLIAAPLVDSLPPDVGSGITAIAAGTTNFALKDDGRLVYWGPSKSHVSQFTFELPSHNLNTQIVSISTLDDEVLALTSDGSVHSWGIGSELNKDDIPSDARSNIAAIAAGGLYNLGLKTDGSVIAWGFDHLGTTTIPVEAQSNVTSISAGAFNALALRKDGSVVAWGLMSNINQVPADAQSGVTSISAGLEHALALKSDGSVIAWGDNTHGQTDVPPSAQSNVIAVSAGGNFSLALKNNGSVIAWGDNNLGQTSIPPEALTGISAISAGFNNCLALKNDGSVIGWGPHNRLQTEIYSRLVDISFGKWSTLALLDDGSVIGWADPDIINSLNPPVDYGQWDVPTEVQSDVRAIASGDYHSLALKTDGTLIAWGRNNLGQTNIPTIAQNNIAAIAAHGNKSFVIKEDGTLHGWGEDDSSISPGLISADLLDIPIEAQSGAISIDFGFKHAAVLKSDGSVVTWGILNFDENNNPSPNPHAPPVEAQSGVTAIATIGFHTMALKDDGSVIVWPDGPVNLGPGPIPNQFTQIPIEAQSNIIAIDGSPYHCFALRNDGAIIDWGHSDPDTPLKALSGVTDFFVQGSTVFYRKSDTPTPLDRYYESLPTLAPNLTGLDRLISATPFNDNHSNLIKYAFNMNLGTSDVTTLTPGGASGLPTYSHIKSSPSDIWRVEYLRRKNSGLNYTPLKSADLSTFIPMTGTPTIIDIDDEWERVVIEEPCDPTNDTKCFSKVKVSLP